MSGSPSLRAKSWGSSAPTAPARRRCSTCSTASCRRIHVILDNLNTHKPKRERWLARHKNVHFHFTPTHASWLNQVECWFSVLGGASLRGASFTSVAQLRKHIDAFVERYNQTAHPFAWSKSEVHQKRLKPRFADL